MRKASILRDFDEDKEDVWRYLEELKDSVNSIHKIVRNVAYIIQDDNLEPEIMDAIIREMKKDTVMIRNNIGVFDKKLDEYFKKKVIKGLKEKK